MEEELVELYRADPLQADLVRARLEGSGIEAVIFGSGASAAYPGASALGATRVMVRQEDVERAHEILDQPLELEEEEEEDYEEYQPVLAEPARRHWFFWAAVVIAFVLIVSIVTDQLQVY